MGFARLFGSASILASVVLTSTYADEPPGGYAVVISKATQADPEWDAVAQALVEKHEGAVVVHDGDVAGALPRLKELFPRYTCFVARPEEAGKEFIARVHAMTRRLDDDPYTDTSWGVVTGYTPDAALRIARLRAP